MKNLISSWDLVIVGSGPAGMSAGIYAARAGLKVAILESGAPGGKIIKTNIIENYPGFNSIGGIELAQQFIEHATNSGSQIIYHGIKSYEKVDNLFSIVLQNDEKITAKTMIIATGTKEREIGVDGEQRLYAKGVTYCAVCDGPFYRSKEVMVVGGGYSAVKEATYLSNIVKKVILVHRRQGFRTDDLAVENLQKKENVDFILDSVVTKINGKENVESVEIRNVVNNEIKEVKVSAIFPYVGSDPITGFVNDKSILDKNGYVITNEYMETTVEGLYAAGDVRKSVLRQVITAASDGSLAGQMAVEFLQK